MARKTKEERLELVKQDALKIGLPQRHAEVLAKIGVKRNLDSRIKYLIEHYREYGELMGKNKVLSDDPTSFYLTHKVFKYPGSKKFSRYGTLSYEYSQASPYNLVNILIKDASYARAGAKMIKALDGVNPENGEEYSQDFFDEVRFSELEKAFLQDIKSNNIPKDMVDAIFASLKYEKRPIIDVYGVGSDLGPTKKSIMDSFYVFFSSKEGATFLNEWKDEIKRPNLVDSFTYRFFNDPTVNPYLIDRHKEDVGKADFTKASEGYKDSVVFYTDGTPVKIGTINRRLNDII